jgi:hypothetical protein
VVEPCWEKGVEDFLKRHCGLRDGKHWPSLTAFDCHRYLDNNQLMEVSEGLFEGLSNLQTL